MASYTIAIDLTAEDRASAPIQGVEDSLGGLSKSQTATANSTKQLAEETGRTNQMFGQFKNEITGVIASIGLMTVAQKIGEFMELGKTVNVASASFTQLSGGVEQAEANLELMRRATGYVISDSVLMQQATSMMLTGIAQTGDEAARLVSIGSRLGTVLGVDARESVANLNSAIQNMSYVRLDTLGISATAVRERVKELTAAGMDLQAAFSSAVTSAGEEAIRRLGSAADAAITPWDTLMTRINNGLEDMAGRARTGFDALTGLVMYATGSLPQQQAQMEAARQAAVDVMSSLVNGMQIEGDVNPIGEFVRREFEAVTNDPTLAGDMQRLTAMIFTQMGTTADEMVTNAHLTFGDVFNDLDNQQVFQQLAAGALQYKSTAEMAAAETAALNTQLDGMKSSLAAGFGSGGSGGSLDVFGNMFGKSTSLDATAAMADQAASTYAITYWGTYTQYWRSYQQQQADAELQATWEKAREQGEAAQQIFNEFMAQGTAAPMTMGVGDQANAMKAQYEQMAADFEHLQEMNKDGILSDSDLQKANDLMQSFKESADAVDRIAGMNLSELLGEGSGGVKGELGDKVVNYMQEHDFSGAAIEQAKGAFDLSSGRVTGLSNFLDSDVIPMLAQLKPEDSAAAQAQIVDYLQKAEERGLTDAQKIDDLKTLMGQPGGQGQTFTISPWQSPNFQAGIASNALNPAEMAKNMSIPGMSFTAADFSGMSGLSSNTQMTYEQLEPIIKQNLLENIRKQYTSESGVQVRSDSDIQSDPAFQQMVKDLTAKGLAQANAAVSQISGTGYTTASAAAAGLHVDQGQVLAAAGVSDPRMLQPGTYTLGGYGFNPNFDVNSLFTDQGAGAGPTDMTQNLKDMVEPAQQVSGSMTEVQDSTKEIGANLDTVRESLDSLSKGTHKINVELNITNLDFINSLVVGQGMAAGGGTRTKPVRDQGGTVKGMDARTLD